MENYAGVMVPENGTASNVFSSTDTPATTETTDPTDYELGMRFTANAAGSITELRYFRGAADASDTDTRVMNLWNAAGVLLGSVTVTSAAGESGWQVGTLSTPIAIHAGATYVVSYGTTQNYNATANYFTTAHSGPDGVLTAGASAGVFAEGTPGIFPTASYNSSNYWVDVTFIPNSAPVITAGANFTSPENRSLVTTITATDADANPLTYAIVGGADAALFTIDASTGLLRFVSNPNYEAPADAGANNVYDLTVIVSDGIAPAVTQEITVSITDRAEYGTGSNVFGSIDAPTTTETTDPTEYELGMRFTANAVGSITELRYFRSAADAGDTDTRILNLWNAAGILLGSVTVTSTAGKSGWQVGTLSAPIAIQAGATYVVSYGTTQNYAATANYFTTAHSGPDGVLTAGAASGVFAYGTPGVFPTASYNASNYWADVTFVDAVAPTATIVVADDALRAGESSLVTITFSKAVSGLTNADLTIANGTLTAVSSDDGGVTWTATFTPSVDTTEASNLITLDNTGVSDGAGNTGLGTTDSNNYAIDTLRPTAAIVVADDALRAGESSLVTIIFSEAVSGLTNDDLTIANGTLTAVSSGDGGVTWTATFTPIGRHHRGQQPDHPGQHRGVERGRQHRPGDHRFEQLRDRHAASDGRHRGGGRCAAGGRELAGDDHLQRGGERADQRRSDDRQRHADGGVVGRRRGYLDGDLHAIGRHHRGQQPDRPGQHRGLGRGRQHRPGDHRFQQLRDRHAASDGRHRGGGRCAAGGRELAGDDHLQRGGERADQRRSDDRQRHADGGVVGRRRGYLDGDLHADRSTPPRPAT